MGSKELLKLKNSDLEIIKLTTKELLLNLFDLTTPFYLASSMYRKPIQKYLAKRSVDRSRFFERIGYLKRQGYIQTLIKRKEKYVELTLKGKNRANFLLLENLSIKRPTRWDGKWRVIIFDIPEKLRQNRNIFRSNIKSLGFIQIQKSVYVYPFECALEISLLSDAFLINKYVTIMISEIIQGEEKIINEFFEKNIFKKADLKVKI